VFQQVIQVINSSSDNNDVNPESVTEEQALLAILNIARDRLTEADYEMFIWEDPELSM
jgi:hypothetical protein